MKNFVTTHFNRVFSGLNKSKDSLSNISNNLGYKDKTLIKILSDYRVQFTEIQIVEDTIDGLWVTGLPKDVTIITVGQEYVINGQEVKVQMLN